MLEFDVNKVVGAIQTTKSVTETDIEAIIVGSFEGGSNYWLGVDNTQPEWTDKSNDQPVSIWATKLLLEGKTIHLYDVEDSFTRWELTLPQLINGIQLNSTERPHDSDLETGDSHTCDCIVQYALFGELVYN